MNKEFMILLNRNFNIGMYDPEDLLIDLKGSYDYFKTTECFDRIKKCFIGKGKTRNFNIHEIDILIDKMFHIHAENLLLTKTLDDDIPRNELYYKVYDPDLLKDVMKIHYISKKDLNTLKIKSTVAYFINKKYKETQITDRTYLHGYAGLLSIKPNVIYKFGNLCLLFKDENEIGEFLKSVSSVLEITTVYERIDTDSDIYKEILNRIDWDNHVYSYHEVHDVKDINIDKDKLDQLLRSFLNGFIEVKKKEYLDELVEDYKATRSKILQWKEILLLKNVELDDILKYKNKELTELYKYVNANKNYYVIMYEPRLNLGLELDSIVMSGILFFMFDVNTLSDVERRIIEDRSETYELEELGHLELNPDYSKRIYTIDEFSLSTILQVFSNISIKTDIRPTDANRDVINDILGLIGYPTALLYYKKELCARDIESNISFLDKKIFEFIPFTIDKEKMSVKHFKSLLDLYKSTREIGLYDIPDIIYYKDNERHRTNIDNLLSVIDKMKEGYKFEIDSIRLTDKYISLLKDKYFKDCLHSEYKT